MLHERMTKMTTINPNAGYCSARAAAAVIGFLAVTTLAQAADLTLPPAAAPAAYNWSGLYIGLNAGYAAAKITETVTGGGSGSANIPAGLGGLQIGANVQTGAIVWGFEGDFDGNMATKSVAVAEIGRAHV